MDREASIDILMAAYPGDEHPKIKVLSPFRLGILWQASNPFM
jgi:hypothetical protein